VSAPRFIVVGAGVMGCALASELARRGAGVVVVEQGEVCSGSSGRNAGGVRQQFSSATNVRLARRTLERVGLIAEEFGVDVGFRQVGYLFLAASDEGEARLRGAVSAQNALDVPTRFVGVDEIAELVPGVNTADLRGGSFCPTDGHLDPHALVSAFASDARRHGAVIRQDTRIVGADRAGERLTALRTVSGEAIGGDVVVNCAGAWAGAVAGLYGGELPIQPWRSQVFIVTHTPPLGDRLPMTIDFDNGKSYFHREGDGLLAGMDNETATAPTVDVAFDYDKVDQLVEHLAHRLPALVDARVATGWAGLLELTPDENPLVGWTHLENVYTAAGFSGHGLSIAPALAQDVARELLGEPPEVPLDAFRPERFAGAVLEVEALSMR